MNKDLASAILLERCGCYRKSLTSAKKVLENGEAAPDEVLWARRIVTALAEVFVSQRFMDTAMECYQLLVEHAPPELDGAAGVDACPEPDEVSSPFAELGPDTVTVTTRVNEDVFEILQALKRVEGNEGKDDADLVREGIYLLFLKYAEDKGTRELIFDKIRTVVD